LIIFTLFSHCESNNDLPSIGDSPFPSITSIELQPNRITTHLQDLGPSKAAGPDQIPGKFLKLFAKELYYLSLLILLSASLKQNVIPSDWKKAIIIPFFKKGSRSDPANYRPILLTSILCKIL